MKEEGGGGVQASTPVLGPIGSAGGAPVQFADSSLPRVGAPSQLPFHCHQVGRRRWGLWGILLRMGSRAYKATVVTAAESLVLDFISSPEEQHFFMLYPSF